MKTRLTIEVSEEIKNEAKSKAYSEGMTIKEKITKLILAWLQNK